MRSSPSVLPQGIVPLSTRRRRKGVLTGKTVGRLFVRRVVGRKQTGQSKHWTTWYECDCSCGRIVFLSSASLNCRTRTCGCGRRDNRVTGSAHYAWRGFGEIPGRLWNQITQGARSRDLLFKLTISDAWSLFLKQRRRCALSGTVLTMSKNFQEHGTASLDRVDSAQGYFLENVQWVHKDVNMMKQRFTQQRFVELCVAIARKNRA